MDNSKFSLIPKIKELYNKGENLILYLKKLENRNQNSIEDILISYDFQAGSYIEFAHENQDYIQNYTTELASIINRLGDFTSILEIGVGEATTLGNLIPKIKNDINSTFLGFDISWSRISEGRNYLNGKNIKSKLFVADLFHIPLADNSIDIVYTSHSIEPNGGKEKEALIELYRITKKFLILLEPTIEFADENGKKRMKSHGYVSNILGIIEGLKYNLIEYKKFPFCANELNPTGLYIIKKDQPIQKNEKDINFVCPISLTNLVERTDHFFSEESLLSYPKINGIPCLLSSYAILTSKNAK